MTTMFEKDLLQLRLERAYKALQEFSIDLWVMLGRETHFTAEPALQFLLPAAVLNNTALVVSKKGGAVCLAGAIDAEEIEAFGPDVTVRRVKKDFEGELTEILRTFLPASRIALDYSEVDPSADGLSLTQYRRLQRCFRAAGFDGETVSACNVMKRVRAQKSPQEVAGIERTVLAAMKIYEESRNVIRSGMSGRDIQRYFQEKVHELGAGYSWPKTGNPYVSVGARSSYLCKRPPDDVFAMPGDLINVDFGLRVDGFASDNQRSYYVQAPGETAPPDEVQRAFEAVQAAIRAAVGAAAPGVCTTVCRDAANAVFASRGFPAVGGLGHELGTFAHEGGMRIGSDYSVKELDCHLEEGMCFTMEPAILTKYGRLCQEEDVAITKDGCRMLSTPQTEVWLVR